MDDNQMCDLRLSRRDVGRLLVGVRERRRKLARGLEKFKDNFDPELGGNMTESFSAYSALEQALKEAMNDANDHPRRAGRNPRQHQGRRDAPGDHRAPGQQA